MVLLLITSILFVSMSLVLYSKSILISLEIPIFSNNDTMLNVSVLLDWVTCMFMSTVMFISSMILIFSLAYIPKTEYTQFSLILLCFVSSMLLLIMSDNIIFMLLGWDGLGLSSFILVVYYQNHSSASSGVITILSNRLGDIAIILSISILMMKMNWNFEMNNHFPKIVLVLLMIAAISKSAQFPFSSWLPAAMAAPTPISALVHSSTLVTAGVYLLIRLMNVTHPSVLITLMMLSAATTLYSSMSANWEQDLKKIIALSTLSQIGLMMFAISINAPSIAFLHMIIHALFKSMMFMCAGMMIHNFSYQDMRHMGSMPASSPLLLMVMALSTITLMGVPFMSGFFSKDSIMEMMLNSTPMSISTLIMLSSIGMTATYSWRMMKISMKYTMKSKPDSMFLNPYLMELPLIIMTPHSIFTGAIIMWMIFPTQIFFCPTLMKFVILMTIVLGLLMGLNINFKSTQFNKNGKMPFTLWFLNSLSTLPSKYITPLMLVYLKNDKMWQEMYGPQLSYKMLMYTSKMPNMLTLNPSFTLMMLLLSPLFILMIR